MNSLVWTVIFFAMCSDDKVIHIFFSLDDTIQYMAAIESTNRLGPLLNPMLLDDFQRFQLKFVDKEVALITLISPR